MAKMKVEFELSVNFKIIELYFEDIVADWVHNHQKETSSTTKALNVGLLGIGGVILNKVQSGSGLIAHSHVIEVKIPMSMFTFGGKMVVSIKPEGSETTIITISGQTQGIFKGSLEENVNGLQEYLIQSFHEYQNIYRHNQQDSRAVSNEIQEIEKLYSLFKDGAITEKEFSTLKLKYIK